MIASASPSSTLKLGSRLRLEREAYRGRKRSLHSPRHGILVQVDSPVAVLLIFVVAEFDVCHELIQRIVGECNLWLRLFRCHSLVLPKLDSNLLQDLEPILRDRVSISKIQWSNLARKALGRPDDLSVQTDERLHMLRWRGRVRVNPNNKLRWKKSSVRLAGISGGSAA